MAYSFASTTLIMVPTIVSTPEETRMVMTTSFIWQQIDLGIHNIMYQLSRQLAEIVKPMVQNKMHQSKELKARKAHVSNNYALFVPINLEVMNRVSNHDSAHNSSRVNPTGPVEYAF